MYKRQGPSGVGKTTILRTIAGLQKISSGEIYLKNKIISSDSFHLEPEKRNIALSFQDNSLFPNYKVIDNINFGKKRSNGNRTILNANDIIKLLHIDPILEKFPHQISAGEAQRVSLARSIMSKPDLLLLDEPSLGLSPKLVDEVFTIIQNLHKSGVTILLVEQNVNHALKIADYGYVLTSGKIFLSGTYDELYKEEKVRDMYLGEGQYVRRSKLWQA